MDKQITIFTINRNHKLVKTDALLVGKNNDIYIRSLKNDTCTYKRRHNINQSKKD